MRISRKKDDAGYAEWMHILQVTPQIEHLVEIKFDGEAVPVADVVTADSETGVLITLVEGMDWVRYGEVSIVIPGRTEPDEEVQRQVKRVREIVARFVERLYAEMQVYEGGERGFWPKNLVDVTVLIAERALKIESNIDYLQTEPMRSPEWEMIFANTIDLIMKDGADSEIGAEGAS